MWGSLFRFVLAAILLTGQAWPLPTYGQKSISPADSLEGLKQDFGKYQLQEIVDQLRYISTWAFESSDGPTRAQSLIYLSSMLHTANDLLGFETVMLQLDSIRQRDTSLTVLQRSTILNNYAQLKKTQGNFSYANKLLFAAIELEKSTTADSIELSTMYHNISANYRRLGDYENSIVMIKQAKMLLKAKKNSLFELASDYYHEGLSHKEKGQLILSIDNLEKGISMIIKKAVDDKKLSRLLIQLYQTKAEVRIKQSLLTDAEHYVKRAQQLQVKDKHRTYRTVELQGLLAIRHGKKGEAEKHLREALSLARQELADNREFNTIARIHRELGDLLLSDQKSDASLTEYEKGLMHYSGSSQSELSNTSFIDGILLSNEGQKLLIGRYRAEQNNAKKIKAVDAAVAYLDRLKSSYLTEGSKFFIAEQASEVYTDALAIYLQEPNPSAKMLDKAFRVMEKNKAGVLLEQLQHKFNLLSSDLPQEVIQQEVQLQKSLSHHSKMLAEAQAAGNDDDIERLQSVLFKVKEELTIFKSKIPELYPDYSKLKQQIEGRTRIADVQAILSSDHVFIEYMDSPEELLALVITKGDTKVVRLDKKTLAPLLTSYVEAVSVPPSPQQDPSILKGLSSQLCKVLLPAEMESYTHAIIIPEGLLSRVPFESLMLGDGTFLVEHTSVQYAYSADQIIATTKRTSNSNVLCIAPVFEAPDATDRASNGMDLRALPFAEKEAKYIAETCDAKLINSDTTSPQELTSEIGDYNVIHLATHASINTTDPMLSEIHFNTGSLTNYDIRDLNVRPDLVVLNACNTANGKLQNGEGIIGVSRGFFQAGVKCLQSNLWEVNDRSSSQIVTSMYDHMQQGETISKALQQAKIEYLSTADKRRAHPYYWAGMVQIGQDSAPLGTPGSMPWLLLALAILIILLLMALFKKRA